MHRKSFWPGAMLPVCFLVATLFACSLKGSKVVGPTDTRVRVMGWELAGAVQNGTAMGFGAMVRCGNSLFISSGGDGAGHSGLLTATIPDFIFEKFSLPDSGWNNYYLAADSVSIWIPTTNKKIWQYDTRTNTFTNIVADWREFCDTTRKWNYGTNSDSLRLMFFGIAKYNGHIYVGTRQDYGTSVYPTWDAQLGRIYRYEDNGHWSRADSGWRKDTVGLSNYPGDFYVAGGFLWTTGDCGVWKYNGTSWQVIPGTITNRFDTTIGINSSGLAQDSSTGDFIVGTDYNGIWAIASDGSSRKDTGLFYSDYSTGTRDTVITDINFIANFLNYHGLLISPFLGAYRDSKTRGWNRFMVNTKDTLWLNLEGDTVLGPSFQASLNRSSTNWGDTIISTFCSSDGNTGGLLMFDLNKSAVWRSYKKNGYRFK